MSRIHDALRKAEEERRFGRGTPQSAFAPDNPTLETADLFAIPNQIEEEMFPANSLQSPMASETVLRSSILIADDDTGRLESSNAPVESGELVQRSNAPKEKIGTKGLTPECMEQFRTLRMRLNQARSTRPLKRLLVSSALPGEGKTFMAAKLGQVLAQQKDCRVLLIDGDLRCGTLHAQMDVAASPGVTDLLKGTHDDNSVMHRSVYDGVYVIPSGECVSQSAELLASGHLKVLFDRLGDSFDWVIVDSPAITLISDACILAEACDAVVLVIEAGATPFDLAQKAKLAFEHTPVIGAVLNRAMGNHKSYSHYYQPSLENTPATTLER